MKNWRTTTLGILGAIGMICTGVASAIDNDPSTIVDISGLIQAIGVIVAALGIGGAAIHAKDAKEPKD